MVLFFFCLSFGPQTLACELGFFDFAQHRSADQSGSASLLIVCVLLLSGLHLASADAKMLCSQNTVVWVIWTRYLRENGRWGEERSTQEVIEEGESFTNPVG